VFVQWIRSDAREAARFDRAADRSERRAAAGRPDESDELTRYNAYLAGLARRDASRNEDGRT
jgi:hypothetical protein